MLSKSHFGEVEAEEVGQGSKDVKIRWLINEKRGAKNFFMRMFEVQAGGYTPLHAHDWEHEIFVLEGDGVLTDGKKDIPLKPGDFSLVPANETHQIRNAGKTPLKLLCLIPNKKGKDGKGQSCFGKRLCGLFSSKGSKKGC